MIKYQIAKNGQKLDAVTGYLQVEDFEIKRRGSPRIIQDCF